MARGVGSITPFTRTSRSSASNRRSEDNAWLIAGCRTRSLFAARVTLRSVINASNATIRFRSNDLRLK